MDLICHLVKRHLLLLAVLVIPLAFLCNAEIKACSVHYGARMQKPRCEAALSKLPERNIPSIFTTREGRVPSNYVQVPQIFHDNNENAECTITVDLDGHSLSDIFVLVPWNEVRRIAAVIIEDCVAQRMKGGFYTFGLNRTFEALVPMTPYNTRVNSVRGRPAEVENPDGTADDSVAMPAGYDDGPISGPRTSPRKQYTDYEIGDALFDYLDEAFQKSIDSMQRLHDIMNTLKSLDHNYFRRLYFGRGQARWWELLSLLPTSNASTTPPAFKTQVTCAPKFGTPSLASCASLLFEVADSGPVVLDPTTGPLNRRSGNCAIGIDASSRVSTTWSAIRELVEALIESCARNPVVGVIGGFAVASAVTAVSGGKPKVGRRRVEERQAKSFTVSLYRQDPFRGPPNDTCAWRVVSERVGDVRQCPVPEGTSTPH